MREILLKFMRTCLFLLQPGQSIDCSWTGFSDTESPITEYHIAMGSAQGDNSLLSGVTVARDTWKYTITGG